MENRKMVKIVVQYGLDDAGRKSAYMQNQDAQRMHTVEIEVDVTASYVEITTQGIAVVNPVSWKIATIGYTRCGADRENIDFDVVSHVQRYGAEKYTYEVRAREDGWYPVFSYPPTAEQVAEEYRKNCVKTLWEEKLTVLHAAHRQYRETMEEKARQEKIEKILSLPEVYTRNERGQFEKVEF